ncbi:MAG: hypothetical protein IJD10_02395 [Clostridia bacterium]|nr:hypothetical protein [Clostridia bacterium]
MEDLTGFNGQYYEGECRFEGKKEGSVFGYQMYLPEGVDTSKPLALVLSFDGFNKPLAHAMETVIAEGAMPPAVFLGIRPACWLPALPEGWARNMRMDNFDVFDSVYPDILVDGLIPYAAANHGITIADDPDLRLAAGSSSGAIAAWNLAWFRNDAFHRAYMSSPSLLSMGKGRDYPDLMRKCETKPIRVHLEYSENEPDEYFGSSYAAAIDCERALIYAGYEPNVVYFPGEGHSAHFWDQKPLEEALRYLWKGWQTEKVTVKRRSNRFDRVFDPACVWTASDKVVPSHAHKAARCGQTGVTYVAEGCEVYAEKEGDRRRVATFDCEVTALAVSCDDCRLYVSGKSFPGVYALNICPDGSLSGRYLHGAIHTYPDFAYSGATDLIVDAHDRVYAATEMGVQCIRSFGLIDVIVPMPRNAVPQALAITETEEGNYLAVSTADGVYERRLSDALKDIPHGHPAPREYYD